MIQGTSGRTWLLEFELSGEQRLMCQAIKELAEGYDPEYWREVRAQRRFPSRFYEALAADGWLGITVPERYGG